MAGKIPYSVLKGGAFSEWELTIKESFDLKGLYKVMHDFMVDNDWTDLTGGNDFETYYHEVHLPGNMINHDIWWRAMRDPKLEQKRSIKFLKFYLKLEFKTVLMAKKEIILAGNKTKLDNGELRVTAKFYLHANWNEKDSEWQNNGILKFFAHRFWNRINKGVFGAAKGEIIQASQDLYQLIQVYTGMRPEDGRSFMQPKTES